MTPLPMAGRRAVLLGWFSLWVTPLDLPAQSGRLAEFNSLRTPSSPAMVLLGKEPSSVERTNTPADFAAALLNSVSGFNGLPRDFALEASPYWLGSHPELSWRNDIRRNLLQSIQRSLTVSVGTAELGTSDQPIQGLAVSARMALFSGRLPDSTVRQIDGLERALAASAARDLQRLAPVFDSILGGLLREARTESDSAAALDRRDEIMADMMAELSASGAIGGDTDALREQAMRLATARQGFMMDLAGGISWRAPGSMLDSAEVDRWGVWLTASYTMPQISFVGMSRFLNFSATDEDGLDVGARFIYTRDRFGISAEYVGRHLSEDEAGDLWRLAAIVDYRIAEDLWLTGTFGRNYDGEARDGLLAQLGLTLNLFKERYRLGGRPPGL